MNKHDTAQICLNGHVATPSHGDFPEYRKDYCEDCGEKTITECPKCNKPIRGRLRESMSIDYDAPAFCRFCGYPFPWTERKQKAALELFAEEIDSEEDQNEFRDSVEQITKETPQAQIASKRIGRLLGKVGAQTASAIRDILIDVASEAAKKMLFPGS